MRDLKYTGVQANTPPNFKTRNRAPLTTDVGYRIGEIWHQEDTENIWMLTSKTSGTGTWTSLNNSGSGTFTDVTITTGDLTLVSGSLILEAINYTSTLRTQADGTVIGLADGTNGQLLIASSTGTPIWANLTSSGATVTITNTANGINLEAAGGAGGNMYTTDDLNVVVPTAGGNVFVAGGTNIGTTGAGNTITVNLDASPSFTNLTLSGDLDVVNIDASGDLNVGGAITSYIDINAQTGTSYEIQLSDVGKEVKLTNAAAITLDIPANATTPFPIGSLIILHQGGAGTVTVSPTGGVTINSAGGKLDLYEQYSSAVLLKEDTNIWQLMGDIR